MVQAQKIHDQIIRSRLHHYNGCVGLFMFLLLTSLLHRPMTDIPLCLPQVGSWRQKARFFPFFSLLHIPTTSLSQCACVQVTPLR